MTSQDPQCDPISGTCTLPPPNEKTQPQTSNKGLSTLDIFRNANVTTLNNDKGDPVPMDSLPPARLVLLYCSAVPSPTPPPLPLPSHPSQLTFLVMVSTLSFLYS